MIINDKFRLKQLKRGRISPPQRSRPFASLFLSHACSLNLKWQWLNYWHRKPARLTWDVQLCHDMSVRLLGWDFETVVSPSNDQWVWGMKVCELSKAYITRFGLAMHFVPEWIEWRILSYPFISIHIHTCPYISIHVHTCIYIYIYIFHWKFIVCRSSSSFLEDQHISLSYLVLLPSRRQSESDIWKILGNPNDFHIYVIFQRVSIWQLTSCTLCISIGPIRY
jgi:hypothetical protein